MNTQIATGALNEFRGQIKKTWGKLTDEELSMVEGMDESLVGKVQKAYGYTREKAQQEFDKFKTNNPNLFRDNRETFNQEKPMVSSQYSGQTDANKMKSRAAHMIEEDLIEPTQHYIKKAREYGSNAMERGTELVRENPGYTILGAAAVGFLCGAYFARRRY